MESLKCFDFLLDDYDMIYSSQQFEKSLDGLWGPMDAYSFYNVSGCLTFYHLVQWNEWQIYYANEYSNDQSKLLSKELKLSKYISSKKKNIFFIPRYEVDFEPLAKEIKKRIEETGEFFGIKVNKKDS